MLKIGDSFPRSQLEIFENLQKIYECVKKNVAEIYKKENIVHVFLMTVFFVNTNIFKTGKMKELKQIEKPK